MPVVLTKDEVQRVIVATTGVYQLITKLLYGSGLRLIEGLREAHRYGEASDAAHVPPQFRNAFADGRV